MAELSKAEKMMNQMAWLKVRYGRLLYVVPKFWLLYWRYIKEQYGRK